MPLELRVERLRAAGAEDVVVLPPASELLSLEAEDFFALLSRDARIGHLVEGESFCFGRHRRGTIEVLRTWAREAGMGLTVVPSVEVTLLDRIVVPVSSSLVRTLLSWGRVRDAWLALGEPFVLVGRVVEGQRRGRRLGFPTANLDCGRSMPAGNHAESGSAAGVAGSATTDLPSGLPATGKSTGQEAVVEAQSRGEPGMLAMPDDGVYVGRVRWGATRHAAAVHIGPVPTFGLRQRQVEVHVLDFSGDLYGQLLQVELLDRLRDLRRFPTLDQLRARLSVDVAQARALCDLFEKGVRPLFRLSDPHEDN